MLQPITLSPSKKPMIKRTADLVLFIAAISLATSLSSCVSYKNTSRVGQVAESHVAVQTNVVDVEVDFKTRIQASSDKTWCVNEAKDQAYYRAIVNNNIDILVDPIYEVKTRGKRSKASVTGFAGHYTKVRTSKQEKQEVFEQDLRNTQAAFDQTIASTDKKIQEIDKLSKVDAVAKEDLKSYLIMGGGILGGGGKEGGATEKVLNNNISIVEKYNILTSAGATTSLTNPAATGVPVNAGSSVAEVSKIPAMKKKKK